MKTLVSAATLALSMSVSGLALAEPVKIGMITTLSGGGAGLGIDTRDGFMLAIKQADNSEIEVITEDDGQKPELAVQIAD
ncbi:MAG: ABC transporter substrate-binding protein, partial [Pseudorhizobium sp.]